MERVNGISGLFWREAERLYMTQQTMQPQRKSQSAVHDHPLGQEVNPRVGYEP